MDLIIWCGILVCLAHSALFSGLNLAFFSVSRLRLEAEASTGNPVAQRVLAFRRDSNFLLTTILWGNVGINVLLTLLSNSVLTGVLAFVFSTFVITIAGEIVPQAYFSRRALGAASLFGPVLKIYQYLLFPVAKPSAWLLDKWLGKEPIDFFKERQLRGVIQHHIETDDGDVDVIEGQGALNFLEIDDVPIRLEGKSVDPDSVIALSTMIDLPVLPRIGRAATDPFIQQVHASGKKWVIITDLAGDPKLLLDSDAYLRAALIDSEELDGYRFCHRPIVITDPERPLGQVIKDLKHGLEPASDDAIVRDIVLLWSGQHRRVITGADILGRLLRGIGGSTD